MTCVLPVKIPPENFEEKSGSFSYLEWPEHLLKEAVVAFTLSLHQQRTSISWYAHKKPTNKEFFQMYVFTQPLYHRQYVTLSLFLREVWQV